VQYFDIVTRSFRIAWRFKYLWLLAIFSGEAGASFNFNTGGPAPARYNGYTSSPDFNGAANQVNSWAGANVGFLVLVAVLWLVAIIVFFVLAAICEGAIVRAAAEHDAERPFGLRQAFSSGRATMGPIIRFRLLLIALWLPVAVIFVALIAAVFFSFFGNNVGAGFVFIGIFFLFVLAAIPYSIYLFLLDRMGSRAAVLEQRRAIPALARGHQLIRHRLGRLLLVWLIAFGVGIVLGLGFACIFTVLFLPAAIIAAVANSVLGFVLVGLVALIIGLPVAGFIGAQSSAYWTMAFRRLEIDPAPAYGYPYPQPPLPRPT
jgi:uncharacterized membrane protein